MPRQPVLLAYRSNTFFIILTVGCGLCSDIIIYAILTPILPFMVQDRLHLPDDKVQSAVSILLSSYAGASVLSSPFWGYVADRTASRQAPFIAGLVALVGATVMLALGRSLAVLVVGRVLSGISGAAVWTIGLSLLLDTLGPHRLGTAIGTIFSFISFCDLASPVAGGALYSAKGYAGVFGAIFVILAIDIVLRLLVIEKKVAARYMPIASSEPSESQEVDEESPLLEDKESKHYILPVNDYPRLAVHYPLGMCFRDASLMTAMLIAFMQATLLGVVDATLPKHTQELFNFSPLQAGLAFLPLQAPILVFGPIAGWAVDRYGTKPAATIGFSLLTPALILLRIPHAGGTTQQVIFCLILAFVGLGLAAVGSPHIVEASTVVQKYHQHNPTLFGENGPYAQLYGINSLVFSLGLTIGPTAAGILVNSVGFGNMATVLGSICVVPAVLSYLYLGNRFRR